MLEDAIDMAVQHQNTMTAAEKASAEIQAEIDLAVRKFPTWPTDPLHAMAVLGEEYGELNKAVLQLTYEPQKTGSSLQEVRKEAIQTAAMALRFVMSLDRYKYGECEQHHQSA
jgi:NTP pyrophosphatase (non-canonical NTP hydrolase)